MKAKDKSAQKKKLTRASGALSAKAAVPGSGARKRSTAAPAGKSRQDAALQIEARFRAVFESSRDAIGVSKAGVHVFVNPAYRILFGFLPDADLAGKPVLDLIAPDSRDQITAFIRRRIQGEAVPSAYETHGLRIDGTAFDMEVNVSSYQENNEVHTLVILRDVTDRKRFEEEIAERGAMLKQIMDTASVGIGLVDLTGRITHTNRGMAEMFGRTPEELAGIEYVELVHPSEREIGRKSMLAFLASTIPSVDLERLYLRKDGSEFWGHLACRRFYDVSGSEFGLIGVITDITVRKQAEIALKQSEEKYRRLYNDTPVLLHSIDRNGIVVDVNDYWLMTMGYERSEVVGRKVTNFYTEASRIYAEQVIQPRFFQEGAVNDVPYQFVRKNGEVLEMLLSATAERDASGTVVRSLAVIEDVTERDRAEAALRESEERFKAITTTASDAILLMDDKGTIVYWNPAAVRMFGYPAEEALGRDLHLILAPERLHNSYQKGFEHFVRTGQGPVINRSVELIALKKDGIEFPIEVSTSGMNITGRWHALGIIRDISERSLLEDERLKTQKLESIGTLAGGIAHDFNNLLQGVFGFISMAKLTFDQKEKSLAMLAQAEKALHQSVNLTSQLLTFSKGGKPVKSVFDLRPAIENSAAFALSGSRVTYTINADEDLFAVEADEGQIGQVIQNIVLNADQAMPLGGTIRITARNINAAALVPQGDLQGDLVEISIHDQGTGIPTEHLKRIFDPYFTTKEKGSGLGLATAYSIIRNHGGALRVQSGVGAGTTFFIYLPAAVEKRTAPIDPALPAAARTGRVLVMDDEEIIRLVAGELLSALGHEVTFADKGEAALAAYQAARDAGSPFDAVILDLTIRGGMGGRETLRRLLEIDPGVKAIVSSGYSDDAATSDYRVQGFRAFLKKPYNLEELQKALHDLMG